MRDTKGRRGAKQAGILSKPCTDRFPKSLAVSLNMNHYTSSAPAFRTSMQQDFNAARKGLPTLNRLGKREDTACTCASSEAHSPRLATACKATLCTSGLESPKPLSQTSASTLKYCRISVPVPRRLMFRLAIDRQSSKKDLLRTTYTY